MGKVMINGQEVFIPDEVITGRELKQIGNIPLNRSLILQRSNGNLLVPNDQKVEVVEGDFFSDAPTFKYG